MVEAAFHLKTICRSISVAPAIVETLVLHLRARFGSFIFMELLCHRCGTGVTRDDTFCAACGAPQLRIEEGVDGVEAFSSAQNQQDGRVAGEASWRDAILAAVICAVPVGLLCSNLLPLGANLAFLLSAAAAVAAVSLYRRRAALSRLDTHVGLRIGMVSGLVLAIVSATSDGILMVVQRYVLHNGAAMDKQVQALVDPFMAAAAAQGPQSQAQMHDFLVALNTSNGRAALVFFLTVVTSLAVLAFSMVGGAIGARIFSSRRMRPRNS